MSSPNIKIQQRKCVEEILKIENKQTIPHTSGSKENATRRAEMMAETGQRPGRAQIYIATHKNKDGVYINEAAKEICEKIELTLSQSTMDESQISPNDVVGTILGKEHSGRVRCLGLGVVPSKVFKQVRPRFSGASASSSEDSCSSQCQENHNQMMNAFKAYMIMKEGMIPEQFAGFFASPSTNSSTTTKHIPSELGKIINNDKNIFLTSSALDSDRVGINLPTVEVRFEHLTIETDYYIGDRALPTLLNAAIVESALICLRIRLAEKTKLTILKDAYGIIKPSR
ncbi:hypothetical protein KY285_012184 [Solanum tuberosum]|nr:hypothetical protein KY285_012184 [Solanum tuberosum]